MNGTILLDGKNILDYDPVNLGAGSHGISKPNPFPTMSIFDNVAAGLWSTAYGKNHIAETVERSLQQAALWNEVKDSLGKSGISLSGGQQQRLCIARALR